MSVLSKSFAALAAFFVVLTGSASAQVCGDADGSGSVTVTDGVQALRAAAGLSSSCASGACDVDGSGAVTVTDGVNVLRKAAGIAIIESCTTGVAAPVESLLRSSLPIFGNLTKLGSAGSARAATTEQCENSDGFVTIDDETGELTFDNCVLEGFLYDGFLALSADTLDFDLTFTFLQTGESQALSGSITQRVVGGTFVNTGFFDLETELGFFSVDFDQLVLDTEGFFVGGALEFSVDDGQLSTVESIVLNFSPSRVAVVEVNLIDGEVLPFNFDLVSGELTPIAN